MVWGYDTTPSISNFNIDNYNRNNYLDYTSKNKEARFSKEIHIKNKIRSFFHP
jgi:hypothetical protein